MTAILGTEKGREEVEGEKSTERRDRGGNQNQNVEGEGFEESEDDSDRQR